MRPSEVTLDMLMQQLHGQQNSIKAQARFNFNSDKGAKFRRGYYYLNYDTPLQCAFEWRKHEGITYWANINDITKNVAIKTKKMFSKNK